MATALVESRLNSLWETPKTVRGWFATVDHKELGIRYLVTAFVFLMVGGLEALLMRIQLSRPEMAVLSPEAYNQIFTMHGATMSFWYASPILSGFSVYLVPLMIGARDMAYPRLNAFTYWAPAPSTTTTWSWIGKTTPVRADSDIPLVKAAPRLT